MSTRPRTTSDPSRLVRLNKFLSTAGVTSRRKADELISAGTVQVNGSVVTSLGSKIDPEVDQVFIHGKQVVATHDLVYIVFNKPKDCITTSSDERGRTTVMDYVRIRERVFPVGRLDRNTTGVLLLTNDGLLANALMHPRFHVNKAYKVTLDKSLSDEDAVQLRRGIKLSDGMTEPADVRKIQGGTQKMVGIVIHEGRNRQVHRMFEALGYTVVKLDRVAYGDMTYEGLARGRFRHLAKREIWQLRKAAGLESARET